MRRRNFLQALPAWAAAFGLESFAVERARALSGGARPIQMHCDLIVDPAKEQEMLRIFENDFRPAASTAPGFIDTKMLKLHAVLRGPAPPGSKYQFTLTFQTEEDRQRWTQTPRHLAIWPRIEATFSSPTYSRLLYEVY